MPGGGLRRGEWRLLIPMRESCDGCADSRGNFVWVNLGARLGFNSAAEEKAVFQKLLDGGVYIAPGTAYHNPTAGWYRVTFSVARGNLDIGLGRIEALLDLRVSDKAKANALAAKVNGITMAN